MAQPSTIRTVEARTIRVPLDSPTSFSTRQVHHRDYAVTRVTTNDGVRGIGFCYGGSDAGSLVTQGVRELFAPLLVGEDYLIRREIVALSESKRTESYWVLTRIYDASGEVLKAEMLLNHATLKHSYANYEAEAAAL